MDQTQVKGAIVLCDELNDADGPAAAGATGAIMNGDIFNDTAFSFPLPASYLSLLDGARVYDYINKTRFFYSHPFFFFNLLPYFTYYSLFLAYIVIPQQPSSRALNSIKQLHLLFPFLQEAQIPSQGTFLRWTN